LIFFRFDQVSPIQMPISPRMKNPPTGGREKAPKRGAPKDDDDDVDEHGNVAGLIDYEYESEEDDDDSQVSLTKSELYNLKKYGKLPAGVKESIRSPRKAALQARRQIRKKLKREDKRNKSPTTSDSTYVPEEKQGKQKKGKKAFVEKLRRQISRKYEEQEEQEQEQEEEEEEDSDGETLGSEDTEDAEEQEEERKTKKKSSRRGFKPKKKPSRVIEEESEESEEEDAEEEEDEDDEEYDEDYDEEEGSGGFKGISISFGGPVEDQVDRMIPRRHNMKKESEDVRKFVKLLSKPAEENTIDDQIDQFKALESPKKRAMLEALEKRSEYTKKEEPLMFRLLQMKLKPEMMAMVISRYNAMNTMDTSSGEYYKLRTWMDKLVSMPLGHYKEMPVSLENGPETCAPFMEKARKCLDEAIYGQSDAKLQIMQFIANKIANPTSSGLSLLLLGPPGIGKTSLIKNGIAKALEWPFQFISLGGDSDSSTYTGHQFVYEGSHCGRIANCLAQAKSMSMILMFDELDKISSTSKGEEIQNLLVHMTDPVQNMEFEDKYLSGIPLDLSRTMLVFSGNDVNKVDKILMDRMVVVNLAGYETKDKIAIAEQFLLPAALKEVNLMEKVAISRDILQHILTNYAKEETGVRELKRCIEQIAQRVNMLRMFNVKELPFHIPGFALPFVLKKEHVDLFLKKKEVKDTLPFGMYN
jgi:ATP-dependent Lon protease